MLKTILLQSTKERNKLRVSSVGHFSFLKRSSYSISLRFRPRASREALLWTFSIASTSLAKYGFQTKNARFVHHLRLYLQAPPSLFHVIKAHDHTGFTGLGIFHEMFWEKSTYLCFLDNSTVQTNATCDLHSNGSNISAWTNLWYVSWAFLFAQMDMAMRRWKIK